MQTLMAIGGALDQETPALLQEFVRRAGGDAARILVLPQASEAAETGDLYARQFRELGAGEVAILDFQDRTQPVTNTHLEQFRSASAIFFTGGAQMRLAVLFGGTLLEEELRFAYRNGCLLGGTSAGAAILSSTMIAYGRGGPTPRGSVAQFNPGLGFTDRFIFDPHFRQRDRMGRLIYAVAAYPGAVGIGIDENTAAIIEDDDRLIVHGSGAVTIVDGCQMTATDVAEVGRRGIVSATGLSVHVLTQGGVYRRRVHSATLFLHGKK